ncbi:MAG: ATP-binding protein [Bacillota bacterium]|nr:ATP-binding protein [Bacillota bacterium]
MLLYFGVSGFLSFFEWQEMYLMPTPGARLKGTKYEHNFHLDVKNRPMKSVVLFGDNASGKSNWIYALRHLVMLILNGLHVHNTELFHYRSHSVCFKISICNKGREFDYELEYNRSGVVLRESFRQDEQEIFSFADESLNLTAAVNKRTSLQELFSRKSTDTLLKKLRDWLAEPISEFRNIVSQILVEAEEPIHWGMEFLPLMSLEADELNIVKEYSDDAKKILQFVDPTISDIFFEEMINPEGHTRYQPYLNRKDSGIAKKFAMSFESQGIKKAIYLLPQLLQIYKGKTVVIDNLDSSIGIKSLIRIFNSVIHSPTNTKGQLIVSSHNLHLLNLDMFHETQLQVFSKGDDLGSVVHGIDRYDYRTVKRNLDEICLRGGFDSRSVLENPY